MKDFSLGQTRAVCLLLFFLCSFLPQVVLLQEQIKKNMKKKTEAKANIKGKENVKNHFQGRDRSEYGNAFKFNII